MNQKTLLLFTIIASAITAIGQTVTPTLISSQGDYSTVSGGSVSWSIGEPISESYTNGSNLTTMGFQQPELGVMSLIKEQGEDQKLLIYPNPLKDLLNINFNGLKTGSYKIDMYDNLGKVILSHNAEISESNSIFQLKVNEVAAGNYFLKVENGEFSKTVKIVKVN